jgi:hypothetical protein
MAFLRDYKHDIFVSYAHTDNKPFVEGDRGWVMYLTEFLAKRVAQIVGSDKIDFWMDYDLSVNSAVTAEIEDHMAQSALLLFICSESYLSSVWCQRELSGFLTNSVTDRKTGSLRRLFMVKRDKVDREHLPPSLQDILGIDFWTLDFEKHPVPLGYPMPDERQAEYWSRLNRLALDIAATLKLIAGGGLQGGSHGVVVHLAEVTEDLEPLRFEIEAFLRQAGVDTLPKAYYSRETIAKFQQGVEADLGQSKLFVQLLSTVPGRKPPELPQGYPGLQFQLAQVAKVEILQWRSPKLEIKGVADPAHMELLNSRLVIAESIEAFKERVRRRALASNVPKFSSPGNLIFVNTESGDRAIAQQIADCITRQGFGFVLSRETSIRKDLQKRLQECDGAIIVYASSPAKWVERQQSYIKKILQNIDPPPPVVKIYETNNVKKDFVNFRYFQTIPFDTTVDCAVLRPFLDEVRSRSKC